MAFKNETTVAQVNFLARPTRYILVDYYNVGSTNGDDGWSARSFVPTDDGPERLMKMTSFALIRGSGCHFILKGMQTSGRAKAYSKNFVKGRRLDVQ